MNPDRPTSVPLVTMLPGLKRCSLTNGSNGDGEGKGSTADFNMSNEQVSHSLWN